MAARETGKQPVEGTKSPKELWVVSQTNDCGVSQVKCAFDCKHDAAVQAAIQWLMYPTTFTDAARIMHLKGRLALMKQRLADVKYDDALLADVTTLVHAEEFLYTLDDDLLCDFASGRNVTALPVSNCNEHLRLVTWAATVTSVPFFEKSQPTTPAIASAAAATPK